MNAELPPFKNGELNSAKTSTINYVITPLNFTQQLDGIVTDIYNTSSLSFTRQYFTG